MTLSFLPHSTLTADDIAAFEQLITAYRAYGGYPPQQEPAEGDWVLVCYTTLTAPDGQRLETEGFFKRWLSTHLSSDGRTHTAFVDMQFTEEGQALPGCGYGTCPESAPHHPAASPRVPPPAPSPKRRR
ncbi:hypothetical protein [Streptomyces caeruleatus]|uniref:hypothetical protein n=1 Tax=Streptomyces caeruleatus TaxID=661399 RepID=UPI000AD16E7C|nr:hypothetical protein [Streptomyces caeruleatus]